MKRSFFIEKISLGAMVIPLPTQNRSDHKMSLWSDILLRQWISTAEGTRDVSAAFSLKYSEALNKKTPVLQESDCCGCTELVCPGCGVYAHIHCLITSKDDTSDAISAKFSVNAIHMETRVDASVRSKLANTDWSSCDVSFESNGLREYCKLYRNACVNVERVVRHCMTSNDGGDHHSQKAAPRKRRVRQRTK